MCQEPAEPVVGRLRVRDEAAQHPHRHDNLPAVQVASCELYRLFRAWLSGVGEQDVQAVDPLSVREDVAKPAVGQGVAETGHQADHRAGIHVRGDGAGRSGYDDLWGGEGDAVLGFKGPRRCPPDAIIIERGHRTGVG